MAFITPFRIYLIQLRMDIINWLGFARQNNVNLDIMIYEDENNNLIDLEIIIRCLHGFVLERHLHNDIYVNHNLRGMARGLVNLTLFPYGLNVL